MGANGPVRRTVTVVNPNGFHMRPVTAFAQAARGCGCRVAVAYGEKRAEGTNPMDLLLLVAMPGAQLVLEVDGDQAEYAADTLAAILAAEGDGD